MSRRAEPDEQVLDQAIAWHQALSHTGADWDGYLAWLEAEPRHREAMDEIAVIERMVDERALAFRAIVPGAEPVRRPALPLRRSLLGGSIAAAMAVLLVTWAPWTHSPDAVYATAGGSSRHLDLGEGVAVDLAPSSRLVAVAGDPSRLQITAGEAYFVVAHDPSRPLSIAAGGYRVGDIGTRFGINVAPSFVSVAVGEGQVAVGTDGASPVTIRAGQQLTARRSGASGRVTPVAAADVGSWRHGRLVYTEAPIGVVVADLSRYTGRTVKVDRTLRDRRFSGVLTVGDGTTPFRDFADVLGASLSMEGGDMRLSAGGNR